MTQEYTPVSWQDETTSQQGTLINAERLNQMQTAHHFADGFEEVDTAPTADPGVGYHKVVYCTADSTFYRWDGTQWQKDIDDDTKALLLAHEADHANPHQVTKAQVGLGNADNTADADKPISTAAQTALDGKVSIIPVTTGVKFYAQTSGGTYLYQGTQDATAGITSVPLRDSSGRIRTATPSGDTDAVPKKYADDGLATKADKATTYTKTETDTLLASKADVATTLAGYGITDAYTKTEADTLLSAKANDNAVVHKAYDEDITGVKTYTYSAIGINPARADLGRIRIKASNVDITNNSRAIEAPSIQWWDNASHLCGVINAEYETDGSSQIILGPRRANGNMSWFIMNPDYMSVPSRGYNAGSTYSNDVATIGTLDAYTPMVRTTGNQDIAGIKNLVVANYGGRRAAAKDFSAVTTGHFIRLIRAPGYNQFSVFVHGDTLNNAGGIAWLLFGGGNQYSRCTVLLQKTGAIANMTFYYISVGTHIELWCNSTAQVRSIDVCVAHATNSDTSSVTDVTGDTGLTILPSIGDTHPITGETIDGVATITA